MKNPKFKVLVIIYAPSSLDSDKALEVFQNFAARHASQEFIIAKMDGSKNTISDLQIIQYPSIHLYLKGENKHPRKYSRIPTLEGLELFSGVKLIL